MERVKAAHELYMREGLGSRDDSIGMQYLIPGWTFDPKWPTLTRS
ncbi:glucarate dehydratase [Mycobacterium sp. 155]|nr:glucarate dehydratase [Mycobacterium sp. 155]